MSKLLLDERPLVIIPSLAKKIGLNESIILQQVHYWLQASNHEFEGRKWIYNTYDQWQEHFPFWSISTIRRAIKNLQDEGLLISGNFNKLKNDKTKWYSIDLKKVGGLNSPSVQNEQSDCSKRTDRVFKLNRPLPKSTTKSTTDKEVEDEAASDHSPVNNPFSFFEQNGFGTIGSHIAEKIMAWCEDLSDELVLYAMTIAVEHGKCTWRYVEAILTDWSQKKFSNIEQVRAAQLAYKQQSQKRKSNGYPSYGRLREEKTPDWLHKQDDQQQDADCEKFKYKDESYERKRAELEARIKRSREGRQRE